MQAPVPCLDRLGSASLVWLVLVMSASWALAGNHDQASVREGREFFESKVRPVLVSHCYRCHSTESGRPKSGLRLDTREGLRRGGIGGPAIIPGKPDESLLIELISETDPAMRMPPKGKLPDSVVADFRLWVAIGAPDPRVAKPEATSAASDPRDWWSLRPLVRPPVPVGEASLLLSPIDSFLVARLQEKGLASAPEADRRTLIRRLTFDLIGLPPTPEEVDAFLADARPDAYERLVDRLLGSPHYGERLGAGTGWTLSTSPRPTATTRTASGPTPGLIATI